jgi:hypothetical protein
MKECKRFEEAILDYLEGLVSIGQRKQIEKHFENCLSCSNALKDMKNIRVLLRNLKPIRTSDNFETVLRTRISMERSLSRRGIINVPLRMPVYAAAGALVVLAAFFIFNPGNKYFPSLNSNEPSSMVPTNIIPNPVVSGDSGTNLENPPENVNYPMDWVNLGGREISSNSQEIGKLSSVRSDSVNDSVPAKAVGAVEF